MADEQLIKPRELPAATTVFSDDAIMTDDGVTVGKATPVQIVNAGAPVPTEAEAIAGADNSKRMTPLTVKQVLDSVTAPSVLRAAAWAESDSPPDPGIPGSQSAKSWADEAKSTAEIMEKASQQDQYSLTLSAGQTVLDEDADGNPIIVTGVADVYIDGFLLSPGVDYDINGSGHPVLLKEWDAGKVVRVNLIPNYSSPTSKSTSTPPSASLRSFAAEPYDSVAAVLASKQITADLVGKRVFTKDGNGLLVVSGPGDRTHPISGVGLRWIAGSPDVAIQIGVPSDAPTLQAALDKAMKFRPNGAAYVRIVLEAGYRIPTGSITSPFGGSSAVFYCYENMGFVEITSEDAVVQVADDFTGNILRTNGGTAPRLRCKIDMLKKGTDGWCLENGAGGSVDTDCGVINAGRYGALIRASHGWIEDTDWSGADLTGAMGLHITQASIVSGRGVKASNCGTGLYVSRSSVFHGDDSSLGRNVDVSGSRTGMDISRSMASVRDADATGCGIALQIGSMSVVHADGTDCSGSTGAQAIQIEGGKLRLIGGRVNDAAGSAARVNGGEFHARNSEFKNAGGYAVRADFGASVNISGSDCSGAALNRVEARSGAEIIANDVNAGGTGGFGFQVLDGGRILARNATGTYGIAKNKYVPASGEIKTADVLSNKGTATITAGQTSIVVTHGLSTGSGVATRDVTVTPTNSAAAAGFWFTAVGDTTFEIRIPATQAANATFRWEASV